MRYEVIVTNCREGWRGGCVPVSVDVFTGHRSLNAACRSLASLISGRTTRASRWWRQKYIDNAKIGAVAWKYQIRDTETGNTASLSQARQAMIMGFSL